VISAEVDVEVVLVVAVWVVVEVETDVVVGGEVVVVSVVVVVGGGSARAAAATPVAKSSAAPTPTISFLNGMKQPMVANPRALRVDYRCADRAPGWSTTPSSRSSLFGSSGTASRVVSRSRRVEKWDDRVPACA
jgi:hypothetical protein